MRSLRSVLATQTNSIVSPTPELRAFRVAGLYGVVRKLPNTLLSVVLGLMFLYPRFFLLPATPFVGSGDELLFFSRALRIVHGQVLYRDIFEIAGPGTEGLYALGFYLFGQHAWVIQAWHVALGCAFCVVLTSISEQILEGAAVFLPMLLFLVFDFSSAADATHHWYSTLAVLCAVSVLVRGRQPYRIAVAGLLCGVAVLFTQTQGGVATIALGLNLLLTRRKTDTSEGPIKSLLTFLVPCMLLLLAFFGYYVLRASVPVLFYDLIVFPLTGLSGPINSPGIYLHQFPGIHSSADLLRMMPFLLIVVLVPYVYFITLYRLWKKPLRDETRRQQVLLLCVAGLALFLAICSGPTVFRLSTVAPPAILCLVWLIEQSRHARILRRSLFSLTLVFIVWLPVHRQMQRHLTLVLPTGRVAFTDRGSYQLMQWMQARTQPGDNFFNDYGIAFYLKLRNPTHTEFVNNDAFTSSQDVVRVLAAMQEQPPRYIAMFPSVPETPYDQAGPFRAYVFSRYCLAKTFWVANQRYPEEIWASAPTNTGGLCDH